MREQVHRAGEVVQLGKAPGGVLSAELDVIEEAGVPDNLNNLGRGGDYMGADGRLAGIKKLS
jgi:hypothetical protein